MMPRRRAEPRWGVDHARTHRALAFRGWDPSEAIDCLEDQRQAAMEAGRPELARLFERASQVIAETAVDADR